MLLIRLRAPLLSKSRLRINILAVVQVLEENATTMLTDVVTSVAVYHNLLLRDSAHLLSEVRVAEQDNRVDEVCRLLGYHVSSVVDHLRALAVTRDAEFGVWALGYGLLDQL